MENSWKSRLTRAWSASSADNIGILAAGVSYYAFLAFVPLIAAAVLGYGLFAEPETVAAHIEGLAAMLPPSAAELVGDQLSGIVETSNSEKGIGLALALALALIGARNGAASIVTAISMAYDAREQRSFLRNLVLALVITLGAVVGAGLIVAALTLTAAFESLMPGLGGVGALIGKALTYGVLLAAAIGGAGVLYRFAPPGTKPEWSRVRPGAIFAGMGCVIFTLLFGIYVANFGNYNATYGSLGAVVVMLTWLYLVAYVLLFGAELNAAQGSPNAVRPGTFEQVPSK